MGDIVPVFFTFVILTSFSLVWGAWVDAYDQNRRDSIDRIKSFRKILTELNKEPPNYRYDFIEISLGQFKDILQPWVLKDFHVGYIRIKNEEILNHICLKKEEACDYIIDNLIQGNPHYFNNNLKKFLYNAK